MKIRCKLCGTIVEGDRKGTLIRCNCRKCGIDETPYYTRIIGNKENWEKVNEENKYE